MTPFKDDEVDAGLVSVADQVMAFSAGVADHLVAQWDLAVEEMDDVDHKGMRTHAAFGAFLIDNYPVKPAFSSVAATLVQQLADARRELTATQSELADYKGHPEDRI